MTLILVLHDLMHKKSRRDDRFYAAMNYPQPCEAVQENGSSRSVISDQMKEYLAFVHRYNRIRKYIP